MEVLLRVVCLPNADGKQPSINLGRKCMMMIIIIIFYFKNVAFFHAKLGSDVCPRVENQTSGDTLQDLTRPPSGKIAISLLSTYGVFKASSVAGYPYTSTSSDKGRDTGIWKPAVIEFPPPYRTKG